MDTTAINRELYNGSKRLAEQSEQLFELARTKAETEKDYRIALMREIMSLRDQSLPATLIADVARGAVADYKFNRDLAAETYTAAREAVKAAQAQVSALQTIYRYQDGGQ